MAARSSHMHVPAGNSESLRSRPTAAPGTPASEKFNQDTITPVGSGTGIDSSDMDVGGHNFGNRNSSVRGSSLGFSSSSGSGLRLPTSAKRYFHTRRIQKGEVDKPWLTNKDPREKWVTIIPCIGVFIGLAVCAVLVWEGLSTVVNHKYCPVLIEDWSNGFDEKIWTREAEVGGFG